MKILFHYLNGTKNLGLWYPHHNLRNDFDTNFAGCKIDNKRSSETCQFLGHALVFWSSKKPNTIVRALSTAEVEYIVARSYCDQLVWIQ